MHILIICSYNNNSISPFIKEQVDSLIKLDCRFEYYLIKGKGVYGYIKNFFKLIRKIRSCKPDIIHAHYGLSGLLAVLQPFRPVIVTFHGSDINNPILRFLSKIAQRFSTESIFVSDKLKSLSKSSRGLIIPCGVDLEMFRPTDKGTSKRLLGLALNIKYVLFSSSFDNPIKNSSLAIDAVKSLSDQNVKLLELKGYSRKEVNHLLNAVDCALMTSFNEGSPQFIKEAMACNCPIVSTDVGDVNWILGDSKGCFIVSNNLISISEKLKEILLLSDKNIRTNGRERIISLDYGLDAIAQKVFNVYKAFIKTDVSDVLDN
jgi:teichuronic acid biosynthesis glycosyltransferase TuaC